MKTVRHRAAPGCGVRVRIPLAAKNATGRAGDGFLCCVAKMSLIVGVAVQIVPKAWQPEVVGQLEAGVALRREGEMTSTTMTAASIVTVGEGSAKPQGA